MLLRAGLFRPSSAGGPGNIFQAAERGMVGSIIKLVERNIEYDINQRVRARGRRRRFARRFLPSILLAKNKHACVRERAPNGLRFFAYLQATQYTA